MESLSGNHYDAIIIGAGMSGLAAGIRLAHFGKNVLILEKHNAPGGLNSFYSFDGRKYDVGLHAVTNFTPPHIKGTPLTKLFRQLRIDREAFDLSEQKGSRIVFPCTQLSFDNTIETLKAQIAEAFPKEIDGFNKLILAAKEAFSNSPTNAPYRSTRNVLSQYLNTPLLIEMLLLPIMFYGNPEEHDMDWISFAVLFQSIYLEGFARPFEGVRTIIRALLKKYKALGGLRKMKCGVKRIIAEKNQVKALELDNGDTLSADHILSSIGLHETLRLCSDKKQAPAAQEHTGQLSFVETITVLKEQPTSLGWDNTIVFFNAQENFEYKRPKDLVDTRSGVLCIPNNYQYPDGQKLSEGFLRITALANYDRWAELPQEDYQAQKVKYFKQLTHQALKILPKVDPKTLQDLTITTDMFTPRTIKKYTSRLGGAVYGSPQKVKSGQTHLKNLYICGTDQGYLGIIGTMMSGITIANRYALQ